MQKKVFVFNIPIMLLNLGRILLEYRKIETTIFKISVIYF